MSIPMDCSVCQGFALGTQITAYAEDVFDGTGSRGLQHQLFAYDKQLHGSRVLGDVSSLHQNSCANNVAAWCALWRLQMNGDESGTAWFGSRAGLQSTAQTHLPTTGSDTIQPINVVCDFKVWLDFELTPKKHIVKVTTESYYHLRRLR